jgi:amino acid transporter
MTPASAAAAGRLGLGALFSVSIGVIVAQIGMISLTQGIGIGGWGFVAALIIAFAIAVANAMAYAEMALMMPSAGSLSSYAEAAIGNFPAILLVFAGYVVPAMFGLPAELILADQILTHTVPISLPAHTWPIAIIAVFAVLNILGTDVFARVQTALSFIVLTFLALTGLVALSGHAHAPLAGGASTALASMSQDTVILVPEARNANRDLPRAMIGGLIVIFVAQLLFAVGSVFVIPRAQLVASATPHLDYAIATFGPSARIWFAALALVASASLINTVVAAVPRMLAGMAENGQVISLLRRTHPRFGTPMVAILFVACLPVIGLVWSGGDVNAILPLMIASSVSWLFAYIMAQVSLMVLRRRHPELNRPFRVPGYPLVPLLAIAGMVYVVINSSPTPQMQPQIVKYTGIVLGIFAVLSFLWVKLVMKRGLFEPTAPVVHPSSP